MANVIRSFGYSIGKVHTGMINYLCELYQEGKHEPLTSFLNSLGVSVPTDLIARREWNSVDLAILSLDKDQKEIPKILLEVKVDDHECGNSEEKYQTIRYASQWTECDAYFFVTLGMGEYYHAPRSKKFKWVRIRDFIKALEAINSPDNLIKDWIEEIRLEIAIQDNLLLGDRSLIRDYRAGTWNIYLLGHMSEKLKPEFNKFGVDVELTCYTYGARPDTILNFGWSCYPLYMEINYSGSLNLKILLDTSLSKESRYELVEQEILKLEEMFEIPHKLNTSKRIGGSKTIAYFDVGLVDNEGFLECKQSMDATNKRILSIVSKFYRLNQNTSTNKLKPTV